MRRAPDVRHHRGPQGEKPALLLDPWVKQEGHLLWDA
jgi:hypothetical protein